MVNPARPARQLFGRVPDFANLAIALGLMDAWTSAGLDGLNEFADHTAVKVEEAEGAVLWKLWRQLPCHLFSVEGDGTAIHLLFAERPSYFDMVAAHSLLKIADHAYDSMAALSV